MNKFTLKAADDIVTSLFFILLSVFILRLDFLPLVDIPQHAAQISAVKSIINGQFQWQNMVELNFFTPYISAYALIYLLSFFFEMTVAINISIIIAFLLYILSIRKLNNHIDGPSHFLPLSSLFFLGFPYEWGFLTFLFAIPIGLYSYYFFRKNKYSMDVKKCIILSLLGLILFFSHILVLFFILFTCFIEISIEIKKQIGNLKYYFPIILFLSFFIFFYYFKLQTSLQLYDFGESSVFYESLSERVISIISIPFPSGLSFQNCILLFLLFIFAPLFLGLKFSRKPDDYSLLISILLILAFAPNSYKNTALLFQRFAFLLFPAYFILLRPSCGKGIIKQKMFVLLSTLIMTYHPLVNLIFFQKESSSFKHLIDSLEEEKTGLTLALDKNSILTSYNFPLLHFPAWYQSLKNGWIDFNFAWYYPQIVRYKKDSLPEVGPGFEWNPAFALLTIKNCDKYYYLFIHSYNDISNQDLNETSCSHKFLYKSYGWHVFIKN